MEKLMLGTVADTRKPFSLSSGIVTNTQAIIARKRSGKSYTADVEAEEMLKHGQHVGIIDPTGAHWGLRSSADGKAAGFPVIVFGGDHQDAPLDWRGGREMAMAFIANGFSAIWDISNFDTEEQITFVSDFAREMLRSNREAVHIFIDEADTYAPQLLESKVQKVCLGSMRRLVKQGGVRGIGVTLITQRSSDLSKSVLSQVDSIVALTISHPPDISPVMDWISANVGSTAAATVKEQLPRLPVGQAFFCGRDTMSLVKVRQRETFNSGATPKPGERKIVPKVMAEIDIKKLGQQIAASVEQAKANTPEELKKTIAALQKQLAAKGDIPVDLQQHIKELEEKAAQVPHLEERITVATLHAEGIRNSTQEFLDALKAMVDAAVAAMKNGTLPKPAAIPSLRLPTISPGTPEVLPPNGTRMFVSARPSEGFREVKTAEPPVDSEVKLRGKSFAMLQVCAGMYPKGLTEAQVAMQTGMKRSGGTFGDYKSLLKTSGCVRIEDGIWYATTEGMRRAGSSIPKAPTTTEEVLALWMPKLRGKSKDMLNILIRHKGNYLSYAELAAQVDMEPRGGTFGDYLSLLRTMELITTDSGHARANAEVLFL